MSKKFKYIARPGCPVKKAHRSEIGKLLYEEIPLKQRETAKVLDYCLKKPKGHIIHKYLPKDKDKALKAQQLQQVRHLYGTIEQIPVELVVKEIPPTRLGSNICIKDPKPRRIYTTLSEIQSDEDLLKDAYLDAKRHLEYWVEKFRTYIKLSKHSPKIKSIIASIAKEIEQLNKRVA